MPLNIFLASPDDGPEWDHYVDQHSGGSLYQRFSWKSIYETTYRLKTYFLLCHSPCNHGFNNLSNPDNGIGAVAGILPAVHLKHPLFGNHLISLPYLDASGVLADNAEIEQALVKFLFKIGETLNVHTIQLRQAIPLAWLADDARLDPAILTDPLIYRNWYYSLSTQKVDLTLELVDNSESLLKSFKSKLRSQIRKPSRDGLQTIVGGLELVDPFYDIFCSNMRDLGSPVHSRKLFTSIANAFKKNFHLIMVARDKKYLAGGAVLGCKKTLHNPWASALRKYRNLNANMLLYWQMLALGCDRGYSVFDFGRSSPGEGTYRFKKQWQPEIKPFYWYTFSRASNRVFQVGNEKVNYGRFIEIWQKMPIGMTKIIGPRIRKYIGL